MGFWQELVVVSWGERLYLVAPTELDMFEDSKPWQQMERGFLLRKGDESKPADGRPNLPE